MEGQASVGSAVDEAYVVEGASTTSHDPIRASLTTADD